MDRVWPLGDCTEKSSSPTCKMEEKDTLIPAAKIREDELHRYKTHNIHYKQDRVRRFNKRDKFSVYSRVYNRVLSPSLTIRSSGSAVRLHPVPMAYSCQRNCAWHRSWGTERATAEKDAASTAGTAGNHSGALRSCEGPVLGYEYESMHVDICTIFQTAHQS